MNAVRGGCSIGFSLLHILSVLSCVQISSKRAPCSVQVILTLGVVLAQIINIATGKYYPWGWRVSLGLAGLPAIVLTIGGIVLPDTPNSLVERGFEAEGRKVRTAAAAAAIAEIGSSP